MQVTQGLPFLNNPNETYRIISHANHQFCLDSNSEGKLIIASNTHSQSQIWRVMNDNQGNFGFMNSANGSFLQIPFIAKGKQGTQCSVAEPYGGNNQKWRIVASGKSCAIKSCLNPDFGLDIFEERLQQGNKVIIWQIGHSKAHQLWEFIPV